MSAEVVFQDEEIQKFFKDFKSKMKMVEDGEKKFAALLSSVVYGDIMDHFKDESGPDGAWKPWSKIYKDHMEKIGRSSNKILQFNGFLRQNFLPTSFRSNSKEITWFNNAKTKSGFPYAAAHNDGDGQPKREFMWASDNAIERMAQNTLGFILDEGV